VSEPVRLGRSALRIARPERASAAAIIAAARALPGVRDVVVTADHVALHWDGDAPSTVPPLDFVRSTLPPRVHELDVSYDGPDLASLCERLQTTPDDLARLHATPEYEVAFLGFLPGFAYLAGLDPRLVVPRRDTPRTRVAPGAVAIGGPYTGVYPFASPGGWHLIGHVIGAGVWDVDGPRLAPGDRVRFRRRA
jgi:KipI family sensor histidine kinase inhibitor